MSTNDVKDSKEIMNPNHEKWVEFAKASVAGLVCWDSTHKITRSALSGIQDIDVDETLEFFKSKGGHSDCVVLLNVVFEYVDAKLEVDGEVR